jgi:asparaginyl-tRNA synthetase
MQKRLSDQRTGASRRHKPPQSWLLPSAHLATLLGDPWYVSLLELFDCFHHATAEFWRERDLHHAPVPLTTLSVSSPMGLGSDSSPVRTEIGGRPTYLADSQQFALEALCRLAPRGCWYVMPSFRGEANDARHLGQFLHSEAEIRGDLTDIMELAETYLCHLARCFVGHSSEAIAACVGSTAHVEEMAERGSFPSLTMDEAAEELVGITGAVDVDPAGRFRTLTNKGERELARRYGGMVWVTRFDELAVPFYQASDALPNGRRTARNADLLLPQGEALGAGERHSDAAHLQRALARHGLDPAPYRWYIDLRDRRPMRTAGFGLGVERFLLWLLDHDDIRDLQLFLRAYGADLYP